MKKQNAIKNLEDIYMNLYEIYGNLDEKNNEKIKSVMNLITETLVDLNKKEK